MATWTWDELQMELVEGPAGNTEGWVSSRLYPNGVMVFTDDRDHIALEVEATSKEDADTKFAVNEIYVENMRGRSL